MKAYFAKTPGIFRLLYPKRLWALSRNEKNIYLTFDDGPIPEVTPWVLEQLKEYHAKATFFCIGKNIQKHPEIFRKIIAEGHSVGNHTFHHLNGWKTEISKYVENVEKTGKQMTDDGGQLLKNTELIFRPPYGKITGKQAKLLQKKGYQIIMWDVLSGDFDQSISQEKCLENVLKNTKPGSIVIFHDSIKAEENLRYVLPKTLAFFKERGFDFKSLN